MYAKLFASLYQGTLRGCADEILVFTNLLAHADSAGVVDKHWRAIAEECGISRERVEAAIARLEAPDPESRSPEQDGRRLIRIDEHRVWGWRIVNHGKYRAIRNEEDRRAQNREAQERWREKRKQNKPRKPPSAQAEAEAEAYIPLANANGHSPEFDPVKALFDDGVRLLRDTGTNERQARSLIGKWRKSHGDEATREAIQAAYDGGITQPVEWIEARMQAASKPKETWDQRRIREAMEAIQ